MTIIIPVGNGMGLPPDSAADGTWTWNTPLRWTRSGPCSSREAGVWLDLGSRRFRRRLAKPHSQFPAYHLLLFSCRLGRGLGYILGINDIHADSPASLAVK